MSIAAMRVPTVFTAVDRFSSVVTKMTGNVSAFGRTAEAAAMRTSRKMNAMGTSVLMAGAVMAVGIGAAVNEAMKFEKSMSNISTLTDNTSAQMGQMGNQILGIAKKVPVAISELTEGGYDVVSAGIKGMSGQLKVLNSSARLAVAGLGTTKEAVNITTSSLNAFQIEASKAESVTNMLMKAVKYGKTTVSGLSEGFGANAALIKNSNVSLSEYLSTTSALTTTGMTAARAQTQIASAVTALIKPSKTMQAVLDKLGVKDIPKFIKASGGIVGAMTEIKKTADPMGVLLSKAFGRKEGFSAMLSLLGPLSGKFKEIYADMESGSDVVNAAFKKQQKTFSSGMQRMKNSVTVLAIKFGTELIPVLNGFIEKITPMFDNMSNWIKANKGVATTILNVTMGMLALGVVMKVGAILFYGISRAIAVYRLATTAAAAVTAVYNGVMLTTALTGGSLTAVLWGMVAPLLAWLAPIALVVAALTALGMIYFKTVASTKAFAQDNKTHLRVVSGEYESMESRIAKSNERIVQSMKKLKMDLESVNRTGKTVAEVTAGNRVKMAAANEKVSFIKNTTSRTDAISSGGRGLRIPTIKSDKDVALGFENSPKNYKNLAGSNMSKSLDFLKKFNEKGEIILTVKDKGNVLESIETKGINGIPAKVESTTGKR